MRIASSSLDRLSADAMRPVSGMLSNRRPDSSRTLAGVNSDSSVSIVLTDPSVRGLKMPLSYASNIPMLPSQGLFSMLVRHLLPVIVLVVSQAAFSSEVDLNLNSDAARVTIVFPPIGDNLLLDASWLHHNDNGEVASVGGHVTGFAAPGSDAVKVGLGVRMHWVSRDKGRNEDGTALGLGGFLKYTLPAYDRISFGGHAYYAPGVVSFGDVEEFYDLDLWAGYSIIKDADVYLGWRSMKAEFKGDGTVNMDTGLHAGFRVRF